MDKIKWYLDIAEVVSERSTCVRKKVGALIVVDDTIVSEGYVGSPRGRSHCTDIGKCYRDEYKVAHGKDYENYCRSVHAEMNACLHAGRERAKGGTLYVYGSPYLCHLCIRVILNTGLKDVYLRGYDEKSDQIFVQYFPHNALLKMINEADQWVGDQIQKRIQESAVTTVTHSCPFDSYTHSGKSNDFHTKDDNIIKVVV